MKYITKSNVKAYNLSTRFDVTTTKDEQGNVTNWSTEHKCHFIVCLGKVRVGTTVLFATEFRNALDNSLLETATYPTLKGLIASL